MVPITRAIITKVNFEFYYPDEENVLKENKTFRNTSSEDEEMSTIKEKNKHVICRPWSVRIGKNCALGLEYGPRAVLKTSGTVPNTDLPDGK